jgi:ankyrin repeat protein
VTTKKLPTQPSLEQLRRQAKELIRSYRSGETTAQERIVFQLKNKANDIKAGRALASLSLAQLTVAREYGFESWPKLKFFIESLAMTFEEKLKAFVQAATSNRLYYAKYLLQNEPKLATYDLSTACLVGDVEYVEKALKQNLALVNSKVGIKNWEPLIYVCFSFFNKESSESAAKLLKVAELLVRQGANVNAFYMHNLEESSAQNQVPALYGPSGATNFPELAEFLLKSGASPDERESLYHSTEFKDKRCMQLLLKYGANPTKWGALHHQLDFEDEEGVETLLKAGADANFQYEGLGTSLHHAVIRGRSGKIIELLLKYGAKENVKNPEDKTPYEMALRFGNADAIKILAEKSPQKEWTLEEKFIAACAEANENLANEILKIKPNLVRHLPESELKLIADFASLNKIESVKLMLKLGFDLNQRGEWSGPVLHQAV